MTIEHNTALARRYFDGTVNCMNGADRDGALKIVDDLMTDDFEMAFNNDVEVVRGREGHKQFLIEHADAYPDDRWTVEALVADAHLVACQWHFQGRHARSGNAIDVRAADIYRVRDGRLAELRRFLDFADLRRQTRA